MAKVFQEDIIEEKDSPRKFLSKERIIILILLLIFLNLIYLDFMIFRVSSVKTIEKIISAPLTPPNIAQDDNFCSTACISKINDLAVSFNKPTLTPTLTPTPTKTPTSSSTTQSSSIKEYYIPFGSGSGNSADWQDIAGLQASIDKSSYPNIKSVVFEVSLHIPTGNQTASVRLYNSTDGHPVWNSELTFNGNSSSVLMSSGAISLDSGNKTYKVQLKTQLKYSSIIDQSRVHITTN